MPAERRRRLVMVFSEPHVHDGHLEMMLRLTDLGSVVLPPMPSTTTSGRWSGDRLE
jgi:3-polyprenyl-4-hydroxybenzoate decarboxylase